jgi:ArsR family transcriptional regulator
MPNTRIETIQRWAEMFKALSHPHRLSMFLRLLECCGPESSWDQDAETCPCVGELGRDLDIAASTLSHHIKELCRAGLICMDRRGQTIECRMNMASLQQLAEFFVLAAERRM